jgi:hypothetical protein
MKIYGRITRWLKYLQIPQLFSRWAHRLSVGRDAARVGIILVSSIPAEKVKSLLMTPASNLQDAFDQARQRLGAGSDDPLRIALLPRATNTIPVF